MLAKLNKITNWQAALIIAIIGFAVFSVGLTNPFMGDDGPQITSNMLVHSIKHIEILFEGGTFYNGQGLAPLSGVYYRPLMMTTFAILYTLFGPHAFYFHLVQLLIYIGSAILLYLFFRYSFKPVLAICLALVFLVHPINSQNVYSIAAMQDALFFFFGILALYLVVRYTSLKSLLIVAACLFLSLLGKETGLLFVVTAAIYLFWWDKKRLPVFLVIMVLPCLAWVALKVNAVGLDTPASNAPIDGLSLWGRLEMAPSILQFYMTKLIFPYRLAQEYFWVYTKVSFSHFYLPLIIDLIVALVFIYLGVRLRKKAVRAMFYTYLFFAIWVAIGLISILQIIPLDRTADEAWFYFPFAGLLGMIGVLVGVFKVRVNPNWLLIAAVLLIGIYGFRSALRGLDYRNQYALAYKDIAASSDNYIAYNVIASGLLNEGKFQEAQVYAQRSVSVYPTYVNNLNLGTAYNDLGDCSAATAAYKHGLQFANSVLLYESIGGLTLRCGQPGANKQILIKALDHFPNDSLLWTYLAISEERNNDNADARYAITQAATYGQVNQTIYDGIMNNQPFNLSLGNTGKIISIP